MRSLAFVPKISVCGLVARPVDRDRRVLIGRPSVTHQLLCTRSRAALPLKKIVPVPKPSR